MAKKTGLDVAVFTMDGTDMLDILQNATLEIEVKNAEGKGVADLWDEPEITGKGWRITADVMIETSAALMAEAINDGNVAIVVDTGAGIYGSGTPLAAVITTVGHRFEREGLQMQTLALSGKGAATFV